MRFLIVGAGAIGGYFGGRLVQKGEDVTFLVRKEREKKLKKEGLFIKSVHGDYHTPVKTITASDNLQSFDVIILSVKAYQLSQTMQDIRPFIGTSSVILPLLNGYNHFLELQQFVGKDKILGGLCFIESSLDKDGVIIQSSQRHDLVFGEWEGSLSNHVMSIKQHLEHAGFNVIVSEDIQRDIWHKYIFIASMSGITTLMNAPIGPILADANGKEIYRRLISEVVSIVTLIGAPIDEEIAEQTLTTSMSLNPAMKSSMQRDMEKGFSIEADHIHGALLSLADRNGEKAENYPILQAIYSNLKVYEKVSMN